jgi:hypothetical protein
MGITGKPSPSIYLYRTRPQVGKFGKVGIRTIALEITPKGSRLASMKMLRTICIVLALVFLPVTVVNADTVNYSDTTLPRIESITLNPSIVNVSAEGAVLIATIVASDDLNSMNSFNGYLMPFYGANPQASSDIALSTKVVNGRVQVTFQLKYVFKKGTPVGNYQIRATVYDAANNRLIAAGADMPGNAFQVVNDSATGPIDVTQFDYSAKLQEYAVQTQKLTSEVATSRTIISELEKQVTSLTSDKTSLQNELATLTSEKNTLQSQLTTLTSDSTSFQTQMGSLKTNLNSAKLKIKKICSAKPKPKGC